MKFAAIDVGSNAVRLLFTQVFQSDYDAPFFKKDALIRIPIRLGDDAFSQHVISQEKEEKLIKTMLGFQHLIDAYQPLDYMACATSAMREAENGSAIADKIKQITGIDLIIVPGSEEAELIYSNHIENLLDTNKSYLYIDVGGGSTEITLFSKGKVNTSNSFKIGTVRLLKKLVSDSDWDEMSKWLKTATKDIDELFAIGSGGNINKLFRISLQRENRPLSRKKLEQLYSLISKYSFEERIKILGLRPDRADVILPASEIYLTVMKKAKIKKIYVPQVGLADGLIHILYEKHVAKVKTSVT
ncbi:exopolyphosphatase [candidate division KSB1 bacterium]|nr:exopolyphosphatase [candidate division KSB1 bacterium]